MFPVDIYDYSETENVVGVGKSTLLRHIAMREVPIPAHITILFVEQEVCALVQKSDSIDSC